MNADVEKAVEAWSEKCEAIQQNRDFWFQVAEEHRLARLDAERALRDQEAEIAEMQERLQFWKDSSGEEQNLWQADKDRAEKAEALLRDVRDGYYAAPDLHIRITAHLGAKHD